MLPVEVIVVFDDIELPVIDPDTITLLGRPNVTVSVADTTTVISSDVPENVIVSPGRTISVVAPSLMEKSIEPICPSTYPLVAASVASVGVPTLPNALSPNVTVLLASTLKFPAEVFPVSVI